jgi:hypothetical protein
VDLSETGRSSGLEPGTRWETGTDVVSKGNWRRRGVCSGRAAEELRHGLFLVEGRWGRVKTGLGAVWCFLRAHSQWKGLWSLHKGRPGLPWGACVGWGAATVLELRPKRGKCAAKKQHVKQCARRVGRACVRRREGQSVCAVDDTEQQRRPAGEKEDAGLDSSPRHYYRRRRMPRLRQHRAKLREQTGRGRGATARAGGQGCWARGARLVGRGVEGRQLGSAGDAAVIRIPAHGRRARPLTALRLRCPCTGSLVKALCSRANTLGMVILPAEVDRAVDVDVERTHRDLSHAPPHQRGCHQQRRTCAL